MLDDEHVKAFHDSNEGEEFRSFCKTGIAARISNLSSVYTMYLNTLDRQPQKKKEFSALLAQNNVGTVAEEKVKADVEEKKAAH